ncbi:LPXTG cell wall anchor domain-containing protein [Neobacillus niacini]
MPNTATNQYNWLAVGLILILAGMGIGLVGYVKRRNS